MNKLLPIKPEVGQLWADNDPRAKGRTVRITRVGLYRVLARVVTNRETANKSSVGRQFYILLDRLRPTKNGYRLIEETRPIGRLPDNCPPVTEEGPGHAIINQAAVDRLLS